MARKPPLGNEDQMAEARKWQCRECGQRVSFFDKRWKYDTAGEQVGVPGSGWVHQCRLSEGNLDTTWYGTRYVGAE